MMDEDAFFAAPSVPITEITSCYPPRQSSLQEYYNKNPDKLAEKKGEIPRYAVPAGDVDSFVEWGAGAYRQNEPEDSGESEGDLLLGRCVRLTTIGDIQKPKMVYIHGYPDSPMVWQRQIECFADEFCAVLVHLPYCTSEEDDCSYDMPITGFSVSEIASECNTLLRSLLMEDDEKSHLIAHDLGCEIANEMVAQDVPLFRTLTLLGNAPKKNESPFSNFCMLTMLGVMYQYCIIFVYFVARFFTAEIAEILAFLLYNIWPGCIYMRCKLSHVDAPEPSCHPMLAVTYLQKHYAAFCKLFDENSAALRASSVPIVPTFFAYGMDFFNNSDFEMEMNRKGYQYEKVGDNHWFFYTHSKEFNDKLKVFLAKYSL